MVRDISLLDRFILVIQALVVNNLVRDEQEVARLIGERNKQGLTDIKAGRKKLRTEHVESLKKAIPRVSTRYIFGDVGTPLLKENYQDVEIILNTLIETSDVDKKSALASDLLDIIYTLKEDNRRMADQIERTALILGLKK